MLESAFILPRYGHSVAIRQLYASLQVYTDESPNNPLVGSYSVEELLNVFSSPALVRLVTVYVRFLHCMGLLVWNRTSAQCVWAICLLTETLREP